MRWILKKRVIIPAMLIVGAVFAAGKMKSGGPVEDAGKLVRVATPERGELVEIVSGPGQVMPKTKVAISAKVSGRIEELPFEEGDRVVGGTKEKPGSLLVRLESRDLESQLRSAKAQRMAQEAQIEVEMARIAGQKANLEGMDASLEQAKKDFERQKKLHESKDISLATLDQAECNLAELRASYKQAKASIEAAELNLEVLKHNLEVAEARIEEAEETLGHTVIRSPIDGIITKINAEVGEIAMTGTMNNPGTVILEVADLSKMIVETEIDEADVGQIEVGQRAKVHVQAFDDTVFEGTVDSIALTHGMSRTGSKFYETEILLDKTAKMLYSGLTADVEVLTERHEDALKVPSQAVVGREVDTLPLEIRNSSKLVDTSKRYATVVYKLVDGKAVATPVETGASDMTHIIIEQGLGEDDQIVVGPYKILESLKNGMAIRDENGEQAEKAIAGKEDDSAETADAGKDGA
ncbi:efflux RND transporter periplasmic adaptor subunit [Anaerohalosphaera lusitana]|uniref:efflux RND transporter periplasmic adaptor subunit n=1 Tax=Anaerohalosphaera lusitana TaxID=1936003 RepID=UPI0014760034|nr:efflux RND transporter periplasmic adaptor subunit [Anaerohalosphaera lusitana]